MPNKVIKMAIPMMTMTTVMMQTILRPLTRCLLKKTLDFFPKKMKFSQTVAAYSRLYETPEDLVSDLHLLHHLLKQFLTKSFPDALFLKIFIGYLITFCDYILCDMYTVQDLWSAGVTETPLPGALVGFLFWSKSYFFILSLFLSFRSR